MAFAVEGLTTSGDIGRQVRRIGKYASLEDAIAAARQAINDFLVREFRPGMTPAALFTRYRNAGEVPVIFRDGDDKTLNVTYFSHFEYALARCDEIVVARGS